MAQNILQCSIFLLILALICDAKIYSKCEFAKSLVRQGITNRNLLGTWTCIAYHESRFNTKAINPDTGDYGILQISHYFWCSDSNIPGELTCKFEILMNVIFCILCRQRMWNNVQVFTWG